MSRRWTILGGIGGLALAAALTVTPRPELHAETQLPEPEMPVAAADSVSLQPLELAPPPRLEARISTASIVMADPGPAYADLTGGPSRPGLRPLSRADGAALSLAGHRPVARPLAMVRYPVTVQTGASLRPMARLVLPDARWDNRSDADDWTRATLAALNGQRHELSDIVPRDIAAWCPAYPQASERQREAFWVGMISALARYESRHDPRAVGGGGQWYGLMQIYPPTAAHFGCAATSGEALLNPTANLACAARIMTATVRRDGAVALHDGRWRGVAADWGPMTDSEKRAEMAAWTSQQDYCVIPAAAPERTRPQARPAALGAEGAGPTRPALRPWVAPPPAPQREAGHPGRDPVDRI